jgi:hypothetical protein
MTVFQGAVDASFAAFGIDGTYTPVGGEPVPARVIAGRPDTIVGFGEARIHAGTGSFEIRVSEVAARAPPRASPSGAIRIGWCGASTRGGHELSLMSACRMQILRWLEG